MAKAVKLKLVEPSLQDQLEAAIASAANLRTSAMSAAKALEEIYPEDRRLIEADNAGMVPVDPDRDPGDYSAVLEPKRTAYMRDREAVNDLWLQVREADRAVEHLRAGVEASATEQERRAELATAIAEVGKADAELQRLRTTAARADAAVADAAERHGDAAKAVTNASEAYARLYEQAVEQGHAPGRDTTVSDARRAADEIANELAAAKAAAGAMRVKLGPAERQLAAARSAVMACARSVVASAIPKLLQAAREMQTELEAKRQVLQVLERIAQSGTINPADRDRDIDSFLSAHVFPYSWNGGSPEDHPAAEPWLEIIEQLACDAEAALPTN